MWSLLGDALRGVWSYAREQLDKRKRWSLTREQVIEEIKRVEASRSQDEKDRAELEQRLKERRK